MSTLKLTNIQTAAGVANFSINASTGEVTTSSGLEPSIINRGNTTNLLLLTNLNEIHYYETTGSILYLSTRMVPNAIYELTYTSSGGVENTDFSLFPNGVSYVGEFAQYYRATTGTSGSFDQVSQAIDYIYFDHQFGGDGNNSMGKLVIHSGVDSSGYYKMCFYFGADDGNNVACGYNRWTNNFRTWGWIGTLNFSGDNKRCWVRRIG